MGARELDSPAAQAIVTEFFEKVTFSHANLERVLKQVREFSDVTAKLGNRAVLVHGCSRAGKSHLYQILRREFSNQEGDREFRVPLVYVKLPGTSDTVSSMYSDLLTALYADPKTIKAKNSERRKALRERTKLAETRLIVIDELQHIDRGEKSGQSAADEVKSFLDDLNCAVLFIGTSDCLRWLERDVQVLNRIRGVHELGPLEFRGCEKESPFLELLGRADEAIKPLLGVDSFLDSRMFANRLYLASRGLVGIVSELIRAACISRLQRGKGALELQDFQHAIDDFCPFAKRNDCLPFHDSDERLSGLPRLPKSSGRFEGLGMTEVRIPKMRKR